MIEILSSVPMASIQDLGRLGHLGQGVGTSGAMDNLALSTGNLMLGNAVDEAGIEVQVFPFQVRFLRRTTFALTGADGMADLDGRPLMPWWTARAEVGQVLSLQPPRSGVRAYLAVAGGISVPQVLGSRSTQLRGAFGGYQGRTLQQGDQLPLGADTDRGPGGFGVKPSICCLPLQQDGLPALRVIPAAEYHLFQAHCRDAFWRESWKITAQSNRYGSRLAGTPILPRQPLEMQSHGIVPGVIQVPHGGQPIIQLRDAQPMGGYPKIGAVIEADIWRLGYVPIGKPVRFIEVDYSAGVAALDELEQYLEHIRRSVITHCKAA
jgi:biotin-dependent carboxylase-like uncharacterized protein